MNSIGFPKIFKNNSTIIDTGIESTKNCLKLLVESEEEELCGDPYFGVKKKSLMFSQNDYILRDIFINELFEKINAFCPQIQVNREDIKITSDGIKLYTHIKALNKVDFTTNTYDLVLFEGEGE